jgi:queuosine precursor transporter
MIQWRNTLSAALLSVAYVTVALLVNFTISWWPPQDFFGIQIPPGLLLVGAVFVMRDYAQRAVGNWVIALTLIAAVLTYFAVDHVVALASGTAFVVSESIDWLIFKITRRPMKDRIVISSAVAVPFDGLIFLGIMGWLIPQLFWVHYTLKMVASIFMWLWLSQRANRSTSLKPAE